MTALAQLQQRFAQRLQAESADGDDGMAVYRTTIRANYRNALRASYPVVAAIVGDDAFAALVDAYVAHHPSTCGDLNVFGASLGDFLDAHALAGEFPVVPDVARLEWCLDEAARAADATASPAMVFETLRCAAVDAIGATRLALQADCRLLRSRHPVLRTWQRHHRGASASDALDSQDGDDLLLIRRHADGVQVERLTPAQHAWLSTLAAGSTLGEALAKALANDAGFDVAAEVAARIADGTLALPASLER